MLDVPTTDKRFGQAQRCECGAVDNAAQRTAYLERVDGLKPHERTITFERVVLGSHNQTAYDAVRAAVAAKSGLITLTGPFGVGKSVLLMAAVNAARADGATSVYTTMTDLLDWLRAAFNPNRIEEDGVDLSFERRWRLLTTCRVLAIDEVDEMNPTPWALERLCRIFDERWRSMEQALTVVALNQPVTVLPGKVASRLRDGRGYVIQINGADMRPYTKASGQ